MSHKKRAITAWMTILALVVSAFFVLPVSAQTGTYSLSIAANVEPPGVDTGIEISIGDVVQISASGTASDGVTSGIAPTGLGVCHYPEGEYACALWPDPSISQSSLIGQIGATGSYFAVGNAVTFTASASGSLYLLMNDCAGCYGVNSGSWGVTVVINPTSTPTPTITSTPTITPTSSTGFISPYGFCASLRERASFQNMAGWSGTASNPSGETRYLQLDEGESATTTISLSPNKWYEIVVVSRASTPISGQYFTAQIVGRDSVANVVQPSNTATRYVVPASTYAAVNGGYTITLARPAGPPIGLIIEYVCVRERAGSVVPPTAGTSGVDPEQCRDCASGSDVQSWLNWLVCQIRRFFTCFIGELLRQTLVFIVTLVQQFVGFVQWILNLVGAFIQWIVSIIVSIAQFFGGFISNVIGSISNGVQGAAGDPLNRVSSGVRDLPTALGNTFAEAGMGINTALGDGQYSGILDLFIKIPALVIRLIGVYIKVLADLIGLVPLMFEALIGGFSNSTELVSASPTCHDPGTLLYMPCLGFYILDNTIFQGPAFYLIPVIMGLSTFQTIVWAITKVKEAFSSS